MQISRHWRMNAIRYRLEGVRDRETGAVYLQKIPSNPEGARKSDTKEEKHKGHSKEAA